MPVRWRRWWSRSSRGMRRRRRKSWSMAASPNMIRLRRSAPRKWVARCTRRCRRRRIPRWIGTPPSRETVRRWPTGEPGWPARRPRRSTRIEPRRRSASMRRRGIGACTSSGAGPAQGQGDRAVARVGPQYDACGESACCGEGVRCGGCHGLKWGQNRPRTAYAGCADGPKRRARPHSGSETENQVMDGVVEQAS